MASPIPFLEPVSPVHRDQQLILDNSEGESNLDRPLSLTQSNLDKFSLPMQRRQRGSANRDSGFQTSIERSQSFRSEVNKDTITDLPDFHSRTSSMSSGPHPNSSHGSSEYSTDTESQDVGGRRHYRLSVEETQKRRKSGNKIYVGLVRESHYRKGR